MGPEVLIESTPYLMASVVDLDMSFVIQLGVFLLLYILLSTFFFKPYAKYLKRRDESTEGLSVEARTMTNHAAVLEQSMESRLEEARQAGIAERKRITAEGAALRDKLIEQERARMQHRVDSEVAALAVARAEFLKSSGPAVADIASIIERQINSTEGGAR